MKSSKPSQPERRKSTVVAPSRVIARPNAEDVDRDGGEADGEETEIAANINVPGDGGWGWVVVAAAFTIIFMLDGVAFTFGSVLSDISAEFAATNSIVALINSIAVAIYLMAGPIDSALINRFGFRACAMAGSVICSFALFVSVFIKSIAALFVFYGVIAGIGFSLVNMSSALVVGFYFEKLRSLALSMAACGSSIGVMICYPLNSYLVGRAGWRATTLFQSGLLGSIYFLAMTFRPLIALTVVKTGATEDDPTRTVTYLPNLSAAALKLSASRTLSKTESLQPTAAERLFNAVQNPNYPTAATVVQDIAQPVLTNQPGTSSAPATASGVSKLKITAIASKSGISQRQLKQVQSMASRSKNTLRDQSGRKIVEIDFEVPEPEVRRGCCGRLFHWEQHVTESRPMYRDDAFYTGKIEKLPEYQKSKANIKPEEETGLEYQLAVSRATAASDLREHRGVFTTAVRRVLATMLDTKLLKRKTFLMMCTSGFMVYLGYLVPLVFLQARNLEAGVDPTHCNLFVSTIGGANAMGRLVLGALAVRLDPLKLFSLLLCIAGLSTVASNLLYTVYFQYAYCFTFGFCIAGVASLRSMVLVSFYGLDKLTNAYGIILLFQGISSLISTPLASLLKDNFGYSVSFYAAGAFITCGGIILIPLKLVLARENRKVDPRAPPAPPAPPAPRPNTLQKEPPVEIKTTSRNPSRPPSILKR